MPVAEIIAIGSELLLGESQDTNTRYLARTLRDHGISVLRSTIVGDNIDAVAEAVCESARRSDIILTTGGLGPTVDDPTRDAVARALGVSTVYQEQLWEQVKARFMRYAGRKPTENNRRQAYIPEGAIAIENPVGTAPAFMVIQTDWCMYCLPGVPLEMKHLMHERVLPDLKERFNLNQVILVRVLHTVSAGESSIDDRIGDLENSTNPSVGLLAHPGQVDIRITARADNMEVARKLVQEMERIIHDRLGSLVYGADDETLEGTVSGYLESCKQKLAVVECGLNGHLLSRLAEVRFPPEQIRVSLEIPESGSLNTMLEQFKNEIGADIGLGVCLHPHLGKYAADIVLISQETPWHTRLQFGGSPMLAKDWTTNRALDSLRNLLSKQ